VNASREVQRKGRTPPWFRRSAGDGASEVIKRAIVAAIGLCTLAAVPAAAEPPRARNAVALVVERNGPTSPEVQQYSEIMAGEGFAVPAGSSLVFIDYRSCNRVTVSGMTVNFSSSGFSTSRDANRSEQRVACPQTLAPDSGGDNSSVLMRGIGDKLTSIPTRPTFVIVGAPAGGFGRLNITRGTDTLVDAELRGARFDWPSSAPPLEVGSIYHLDLLPERADDRALKLSFKVAEDPPGAPPAIVLIHADR
jgi:hypothetical protein